MPCDHQLIATHLGALLDRSLPDPLRQRCEAALDDCDHCRASVDRAQAWAHMANDWRDEPVPQWNRNRHLVRDQPRPAPAWLGWSALAASLVSVLLVTTQAEVSTTNGFVISFGGGTGEERVQQLIAGELAASAASQNALLEVRLNEFSQRQLDANRLLYAEWQQDNRVERRQELGLLLSGWQNQRLQDQQIYAAQFNELASYQIESNETLNNLMQTVARPGRSGL